MFLLDVVILFRVQRSAFGIRRSANYPRRRGEGSGGILTRENFEDLDAL